MRPCANFVRFAIWEKDTALREGRAGSEYAPAGRELLAVMGDAKPEDISRWSQQQHPVTHTLVARGSPKAGGGDLLVRDNTRAFFVRGINNVGDLELWTVYYVEERKDEHRTG